MFCTNCGNKIEDIATFCPVCGQKVEAAQEEVTLNQSEYTETTSNYSAQTAEQQAPPQMMYPAALPQRNQTQNQNGGNPYNQYNQQQYNRQQYNNQQQSSQYRDRPGYSRQLTDEEAVAIYRTFLSKLDTAATLWLVIGIIQIILGLFTSVLFYGFVLIGVGIWNIVISSKIKKNVTYFRQTSRGITSYIDNCGSGIAALIINLVLLAWLGIIASVLEMTAISFGKNNRSVLNYVERQGWH